MRVSSHSVQVVLNGARLGLGRIRAGRRGEVVDSGGGAQAELRNMDIDVSTVIHVGEAMNRPSGRWPGRWRSRETRRRAATEPPSADEPTRRRRFGKQGRIG